MKWILILCCMAALAASATPINWYSALGQSNFASDNQPMDAGFRFELGVFRDGFVPTAENRDEWSNYWAPAQREVYNEGRRWYSGYLVVEENEAPFIPGAQAYVWGFSGDASGGDWILFRSSRWTWPRANPGNPVVQHWNAKDADSVLIGSLGPSTSPRLLQAVAVQGSVPPQTSFQQWAAENGRAAVESELVEFATGGDRPPVQLRKAAGAEPSGVVEVRLARLADRRLSRVQLEVSEDLKSWRPYGAYARLKATTSSELVYEVEAEAAASPQLFFRARYEP